MSTYGIVRSLKMKPIFALIIAAAIFLLSCAHNENLTEEERQKYRNAKRQYDAGQRGR